MFPLQKLSFKNVFRETVGMIISCWEDLPKNCSRPVDVDVDDDDNTNNDDNTNSDDNDDDDDAEDFPSRYVFFFQKSNCSLNCIFPLNQLVKYPPGL